MGLRPKPILFFLFSEKERTKEKPPEMPTAAFLGTRYTKPYWRNQKGCGSRHFRFAPALSLRKFNK
jgi:hypothetical protein